MKQPTSREMTLFQREALLPCGGESLCADLCLPPAARGIVLFAHGSGSSRRSPRNRFVATTIQEAGIGTLLFDLLTSREEAEDAVTAAYRFDIEILSRRLMDACRWVAGNPDTERLKIGLFGSSTGAAAALVAAAEMRSGVGAVVSRGGRPDLAGDRLERVDSPTLLIVGQRDDVVVRLNQEALARLRCEKELRLVPGATHLFEEPGALEAVAGMAADWFRKHLARPRE